MRVTLKLIFIVLNFALFQNIQAHSLSSKGDVCQFKASHFDNLTVQTGKFGDGSCFVSLTPRKTSGLVYRSFMLIDTGQIMVFNSFGPGPIERDTGSRVFHLFPRKQGLEVIDHERSIEVKLVTGQSFIFGKEEGEPLSLSEGNFQLERRIVPSNRGGFELSMMHSLILDSGFRLGGTPLSRLSNKSVFRDFESDQCTVVNKELFDVKDGEIYELYPTDVELKKFLNKKCPLINF